MVKSAANGYFEEFYGSHHKQGVRAIDYHRFNELKRTKYIEKNVFSDLRKYLLRK